MILQAVWHGQKNRQATCEMDVFAKQVSDKGLTLKRVKAASLNNKTASQKLGKRFT